MLSTPSPEAIRGLTVYWKERLTPGSFDGVINYYLLNIELILVGPAALVSLYTYILSHHPLYPSYRDLSHRDQLFVTNQCVAHSASAMFQIHTRACIVDGKEVPGSSREGQGAEPLFRFLMLFPPSLLLTAHYGHSGMSIAGERFRLADTPLILASILVERGCGGFRQEHYLAPSKSQAGFTVTTVVLSLISCVQLRLSNEVATIDA